MPEALHQPFLFGIYGIDVSDETVRLLRETGAAGIYLMRRNIETTEQVRALVEGLESALGRRLLVAVEHEGGVVCSFTRGVTFFPGNAALARTETPSLAYDVGRAMARELGSMGININLAPLLDLQAEPPSPDLVLRSFGDNPAMASDMGAEMIRGLQEGGISATARHFPGRGSAAGKRGESPAVSLSKEKLVERDLAPFRVAIAGGVDAVMAANARFAALDGDQPAMFSPKIVTDLLRRDMGFSGVVVTEDLSAPSVLGAMAIEEALGRSLQAGCDLLLVSHDPDAQRRAARGFKQAAEKLKIPGEVLERSQERLKVLVKRKQVGTATFLGEGEDAEPAAASSLAEIISVAAARVEVDPQRLLPIRRGQRAGILFPRLGDIADRVTVDEELRGAAGLIQGWAHANSSAVDVLEIPIQPQGEMLGLTLDWAAALDVVVYFVYDAHKFDGQRKLLEELQRRVKKLAAVLIRNPQDRDYVKEGVTVLNTYGFRVPQLAAAVDVLFKPTK